MNEAKYPLLSACYLFVFVVIII